MRIDLFEIVFRLDITDSALLFSLFSAVCKAIPLLHSENDRNYDRVGIVACGSIRVNRQCPAWLAAP